jgi:hypothetical protein
MNGVLIIGAGHQNYGHMANTLAMTIRQHSDIPIHILTDGEAAKVLDMDIYTVSAIPEEACIKNGRKNYFKTKTHIYDLSPFDRTIFLDADLIIIRDISVLFNELDGVTWTVQNRDRIQLGETIGGADVKRRYLWANYNELSSLYSGFIYSLHSEFIYFERHESNKDYFDLVKKLYDNPPVKPTLFAGDAADELAFALACNISGKQPHVEPFLPIYWWQVEGRTEGFLLHNVIKRGYYGYSVGGNKIYRRTVMDNYNFCSIAAARKFGRKPFRMIEKHKYLPERAAM